MTTDVCVLPHRHDPDRPRSAIDGIYACAGCFAGLEQALAEMPAHFTALARKLAPGKGSGSQVSGTREKALPIDTAIAAHRADAQGKLASWAVLVAEERGISAPGSERIPPHEQAWMRARGKSPGSPGIEQTSRFLLVHLRWSCAQPWVDEFGGELIGRWNAADRWEAGLRGRSLSLLYPTGRRRVEVGPCIEEGCDGVLTATIAPVDDLLPSAITCSHDGEHFWEASRWVALGRRIYGAASVNRDAAESLTGGIGG